MPLTTGERLGPYEILGPIGAGGMGEVYKARDTRLNRTVAIKISNQRFSDRFEREARAVAALNHPHICTLHDVGPDYLVMELIDGPTLAERIRQGPMPLDEALGIARQIAEALEAAHERAIVHRDLKPGNVKITPGGVVKVLDFGLAKVGAPPGALGQDSETITVLAGETQAGAVLGTPAYMSPEQARGKVVDRRADIWAFGAVLYEMLTGRQAFQGETASDILAAVMKDRLDFSVVPAQVRAVVEKCLRKDPRVRWHCAADVRIALEEGAPLVAESRPRRVWPWVALALVPALALAPFAFVHVREKPLAPQPVRFQIPPPEHSGGFGVAFSLSPDGRQIAFPAAGPNGQSFLWVRPLDSLEPRLLHGTEGATFLPAWSPDSRFLVFGAGGKLKKIEAAGGPAQVLCDATPAVIGASWSPAGDILFGGTSGGLFRVPAAGGAVTSATSLAAGDIFHSHPFFLPDGRHFLYVRHAAQSENEGVFVGSLDVKPGDQNHKRLLNVMYAIYAVPANSDQGYLLFLRERTLMTQAFDGTKLEPTGDPMPIADPVGSYVTRGQFSASANGVLAYRGDFGGISAPVWFDRHGKALGKAGEPGNYHTLALSPDSTRAAIQHVEATGSSHNIWLIDLLRGGSTRFTFSPTVEANPVWSPDGRRIVYSSGLDLYQKDSGGAGGAEAILKSSGRKAPSDWSRDGRFLIYSELNPKTGYDLWILPMTGDRKPMPFLQTEFREDQGQFSPDGHWVAYMSDASGAAEIYVRPFPPSGSAGGQWTISNGGGMQPRWRGDGKELFFLSGRNVMAVDVSTSPTFKAGVPKVLFEATVFAASDLSPHNWDVTADGQRFLINTIATTGKSEPITVVLNWMAGLKK